MSQISLLVPLGRVQTYELTLCQQRPDLADWIYLLIDAGSDWRLDATYLPGDGGWLQIAISNLRVELRGVHEERIRARVTSADGGAWCAFEAGDVRDAEHVAKTAARMVGELLSGSLKFDTQMPTAGARRGARMRRRQRPA